MDRQQRALVDSGLKLRSCPRPSYCATPRFPNQLSTLDVGRNAVGPSGASRQISAGQLLGGTFAKCGEIRKLDARGKPAKSLSFV